MDSDGNDSRNHCGENLSLTKFFFDNPDRPGHIMGKVDCSKIGLAIIIQSVQSVMGGFEDVMSIPPLREHAERLYASNGAMEFRRHHEDRETCRVLVEPYKPEGIRSALSALQAAARYSVPGRVLFDAHPAVDRNGSFGAFLDVHPIVKYDF